MSFDCIESIRVSALTADLVRLDIDCATPSTRANGDDYIESTEFVLVKVHNSILFIFDNIYNYTILNHCIHICESRHFRCSS